MKGRFLRGDVRRDLLHFGLLGYRTAITLCSVGVGGGVGAFTRPLPEFWSRGRQARGGGAARRGRGAGGGAGGARAAGGGARPAARPPRRSTQVAVDQGDGGRAFA